MNNKLKYALLFALSFSSLQALENVTPNHRIQTDEFGAPIKVTGSNYGEETLADRLSDQYQNSPQSLTNSPIASETGYTSSEEGSNPTSPIGSPMMPRNIYPAQFETPERSTKKIKTPNAPYLYLRDDSIPFSIQSDIQPFSTGTFYYSPDTNASVTSPFQNMNINSESQNELSFISRHSINSDESIATLDRAFFEASDTEEADYFGAISPVSTPRSNSPVYLAMSKIFTTSPNQIIIMDDAQTVIIENDQAILINTNQEENFSSPNAAIVPSTPGAPEKKRGRPVLSESDLQELKMPPFKK